MIAAIALPFTVRSFVRISRTEGTFRRSTGTALLVAIVLAAAPAIWVALLVMGLGASIHLLRARGASARPILGRLAVALLAPLVLLLPWSLYLLLHPALLLLGPGLNDLTVTDAGLRPYDVIVSVDGETIKTHDRLIREIAERQPGSVAKIEYVRDGRTFSAQVKLAERPHQQAAPAQTTAVRSFQSMGPGELGLSLIEIDESNAHRFDIPAGMTGLLVQRVEPLSNAYDGGVERGSVILEINRQPVNSIAGYRRIVGAARPGDVLEIGRAHV